jgi:hypothetical protein
VASGPLVRPARRAAADQTGQTGQTGQTELIVRRGPSAALDDLSVVSDRSAMLPPSG